MENELQLNFRKKDRAKILKSLGEDVSLLTKFNLMDYSLLLCVQKIKTPSITKQERKSIIQDFKKIQNPTDRHRFLSADCKQIYHIGIVDYLQDYNLDKYLENLLK